VHSPIDLAPVRDAEELNPPRVKKLKNHAPVARDAERQESRERSCKPFRVEQRMKGVLAEKLQQPPELFLLRPRHALRGLQEVRVVDDLHARLRSALANTAAPRKTLDGRSCAARNVSSTKCGW